MSDLLQPEVPDEYVLDVTKVMVGANWHTYQVLTKRSERLSDMLSGPLGFAAHKRHVWWGVSVENKRCGLPRIEPLCAAPAAINFLSIEPLLEDLGDFDISGIHWVIVCGESGNGARPMQEPWVENILRLCRKERVASFSKQWGGFRKGTAGRRLNNRTYDEMPMPQTHPIPARQIRSSAATAWDAEPSAGEEIPLRKSKPWTLRKSPFKCGTQRGRPGWITRISSSAGSGSTIC